MSNTIEYWEQDKEWLEREFQKINIKPSEAMIDRFCERVAISVSCSELSVRESRQRALSGLMK